MGLKTQILTKPHFFSVPFFVQHLVGMPSGHGADSGHAGGIKSSISHLAQDQLGVLLEEDSGE